MKKKSLAIVITLCLLFQSIPTFTAFATNASTSAPAELSNLSKEEWDMLALVNIERYMEGLNSLVVTQEMVDFANIRANEMVIKYSHERPDGTKYHTVIKSTKVAYSRSSENIAQGYSSVSQAMVGWMKSPGHKANILTPQVTCFGGGYKRVGNEEYAYSWVQLFGDTIGSNCTSISYNEDGSYFILELANGTKGYMPYSEGYSTMKDGKVLVNYPGVTEALDVNGTTELPESPIGVGNIFNLPIVEYKSNVVKNSGYFMHINIQDAYNLINKSKKDSSMEPFVVYTYRDDQTAEVINSFDTFSAYVNENKIPTYAVNLSKTSAVSAAVYETKIDMRYYNQIMVYAHKVQFPSPFIAEKVTVHRGDVIKISDFYKPGVDSERFVFTSFSPGETNTRLNLPTCPCPYVGTMRSYGRLLIMEAVSERSPASMEVRDTWTGLMHQIIVESAYSNVYATARLKNERYPDYNSNTYGIGGGTIDLKDLGGNMRKVTVRAFTDFEYIAGSLCFNREPLEVGSIIDYVNDTVITARFRYTASSSPDEKPTTIPLIMGPNKDKINVRLTDVSTELKPLFSDDKARDFALESSNSNIVSVVDSTRLLGKAAGTATVTILSGGLKNTCEVTVYKGKPSTLTLGKKQVTLSGVGESFDIYAKLGPIGSGGVITYTSSDQNVARVASNGMVTALSVGTAKITAKIDNLTATCNVTVLEPKPQKAKPTTPTKPTKPTTPTKPTPPTKPTTPTIPKPSGNSYLKGASSWAVNEITAAKDSGLTFDAILSNYQKNITRAEFCKLVVNYYKAQGGSLPAVGASPFSDTKDKDVIIATTLGIANGISATKFAPNADITREEIATMTMRAFRLFDSPKIKNNLAKYSDSNRISSWAMESLAFFNQTEIIKGVSDKKIAPKENATREQAILIIFRTYAVYESPMWAATQY